MITVGNKESFALESHIEAISPNASQVALGFFVIHLQSKEFGVRKPDATMLGCSIESVKERIQNRGRHLAPFGLELSAIALAQSVVEVLYADVREEEYFGIDTASFERILEDGRLLWAPDGDEAFDDGSKVIQYDDHGYVRLIGFRYDGDFRVNPESFAEVTISAEEYYGVLSQWVEQVMTEVGAMRIQAAGTGP